MLGRAEGQGWRWMALGSERRALRRPGAGLWGEKMVRGRLLLVLFGSVLSALSALSVLVVLVLQWLAVVLAVVLVHPVTIPVLVVETSAVRTDPETR